MFNRRNAFIGWLVMTLGRPLAMRKARQAARARRRHAAVGAAAAAGVGASLGALLFWRKRHGESSTDS
jgi:ferric-dicitrate binding protein FerR (iron transport regulator)